MAKKEKSTKTKPNPIAWFIYSFASRIIMFFKNGVKIIPYSVRLVTAEGVQTDVVKGIKYVLTDEGIFLFKLRKELFGFRSLA